MGDEYKGGASLSVQAPHFILHLPSQVLVER